MKTDYIILQNTTGAGLSESVQSLMLLGWQPQGGVSMACTPSGCGLFAQAMVRPPTPPVSGKDKENN